MKILRSLGQKHPITGTDIMEISPFTGSLDLSKVSRKTLAACGEVSAFLIGEMAKHNR